LTQDSKKEIPKNRKREPMVLTSYSLPGKEKKEKTGDFGDHVAKASTFSTLGLIRKKKTKGRCYCLRHREGKKGKREDPVLRT